MLSPETDTNQEIECGKEYGLMLIKPDAVEKDLTESLISHILSTPTLDQKVTLENVIVLNPLTDPTDLALVYPNMEPAYMEASIHLFSSGRSVLVVVKGVGVDMDEEFRKIKGKISGDLGRYGLNDGIRAIIPTVGEKDAFLKLRDKKKRGIQLDTEDYYALVRNLVHTPDTVQEKIGLIHLANKYHERYTD